MMILDYYRKTWRRNEEQSYYIRAFAWSYKLLNSWTWPSSRKFLQLEKLLS